MLRKRILTVAAVTCLVLPAGNAFAGEQQDPERTRVGIKAMDYHFMLQDGTEDGADFPRQMDAGKYRFKFHNGSEKRLHEVAMFKLRHGKTIKQLLSMPGNKAERHLRFMGASFAKPGEDGDSFNAKLIRGRYAMLCFVSNRQGAKPHFMKGMVHRFNVNRPFN
jgi:hypothetical protein